MRSTLLTSFFVIQATSFSTNILSKQHAQRGGPRQAVNGVWNTGNDFGKGKFRFYEGLNKFMEPFPDEDRELYPEMFKLPTGIYEVPLAKPCGIIFEEIEPNKGVYVADLVEGGNAEKQGVLQKGDVLVGVTAIRVAGAKWERR